MRELALAFIDIALHKRGPDSLPASRFLFGLVLVAYVAVSLLALLVSLPPRRAAGAMSVDVVLHLMFFSFILAVTHRAKRFWQTLTAVLGAETFLSCLALPLLFIRVGQTDDTASAVFATSALLLLLIWSIDIAGFVLSRALDRPYVVGLMIMLGYVTGSMMIGEFLFPAQN